MSMLITGAGGGIGRAVVELAVERGYSVIAHDLKPESLADLRGVETITGDLTSKDHLGLLGRRVADEPLEAVVASHGIAGAVALADVDERRSRAILAINASTVPALFEAVREPLTRSHGTYVAVSSQASLRAERENAVYCASKWAVTGWVRAMAAGQAEGPTVRALCPGRTETPLFVAATEAIAAAQGQTVEAYNKDIYDLIPLRRFATTRETASLALYLATQPRGAAPTVVANSGGEVPF
ncbi:SDR family oxidoreductase [Streptomyces sp. GMR22]|nr:SDR family oxidoreductase [Streptomyces sp. GMR22]